VTAGDDEPTQTAARLTAGLVEQVMARLASSRPVFHTEVDLQHAFAWEAHQLYPDAQVRLERRLSSQTNERLDLLLTFNGVAVAVELKYPVAKLDAVLDDEPFVLRAQGAEDRMRFSYVWDIVRLERLVAAGVADAGTAVVLSNVPQLWQPRAQGRGRGPAADTQFSLHDGIELAGRLGWVGEATWWRTAKLPEFVELTGRYGIAWQPYSNVAGTGRGEFRWAAAVVTAVLR
jgi:hypothetical protein